jgi:hypothetical protein
MSIGTSVGKTIGAPLGTLIGTVDGVPDGTPIGAVVGNVVAARIGTSVGTTVGTLAPFGRPGFDAAGLGKPTRGKVVTCTNGMLALPEFEVPPPPPHAASATANHARTRFTLASSPVRKRMD